MAETSIHRIAAIALDSTVLDQISAHAYGLNASVLSQRDAGKIEMNFRSMVYASPTFSVTTPALGIALGAIGMRPIAISSYVDGFLSKHVGTGVAGGTTPHSKIRFSGGLIVPRRLSAQQGGAASLDFEVIATSANGTTAPHSLITGVDLPASQTKELFTLGQLTIGDQVVGMESFELDYGLDVQVLPSDGDVYPRTVVTMGANPTFSVTAHDVGVLDSANFQQGMNRTEDTTITLAKLGDGGTLAGSGDITFTLAEAFIHTTSIGGDEPSAAMSNLRIRPRHDGTNPVVALSIDS